MELQHSIMQLFAARFLLLYLNIIKYQQLEAIYL
nr:MAG TPA: hypothetical protein [Bacteriophage sp.]